MTKDDFFDRLEALIREAELDFPELAHSLSLILGLRSTEHREGHLSKEEVGDRVWSLSDEIAPDFPATAETIRGAVILLFLGEGEQTVQAARDEAQQLLATHFRMTRRMSRN